MIDKYEDRRTALANSLVHSLTDAQKQALAALLLHGDDGLSVMEDVTVGAMRDMETSLGLQEMDVPECEQCKGKGCNPCKGVGRIDKRFPLLAFGIKAEREFVHDLYDVRPDIWEKYKYLEVELSQAMDFLSYDDGEAE